MRTAQEIGQFLQKMRKREGVNQTVMAQRCRVTQEMWSRIERGKQLLTYELLQKIADGVPIALDKLLGLSGGSADLLPGQLPWPSASPEVLQRLSPLLEYIQNLEQQLQDKRPPPSEAPEADPS